MNSPPNGRKSGEFIPSLLYLGVVYPSLVPQSFSLPDNSIQTVSFHQVGIYIRNVINNFPFESHKTFAFLCVVNNNNATGSL